MPHLPKGKCRENRNSGAAWVYKWQKSFTEPIPLHVCDDNVTVKTSIQISNNEGETAVSLFIGPFPPHLYQHGEVVVTSFQEYI